MADLPLVLAGPIVRRVEPTLASVWLALSKAAAVKLDVYQGGVNMTSGPPPGAPAATGTANTLSIGDNLHIVVVVANTPAATPFQHGKFHSYNVTITPTSGGGGGDLSSLGFLDDVDPTPDTYGQPALGFLPKALPGFRTPPPAIDQLRIVQGSCRKPHDDGPDALKQLEDFLDIQKKPEGGRTLDDFPVDFVPQMLFLTGDQIYADEVSLVLLPMLNAVGNQLLGGPVEKLKVFQNADATPPTFDEVEATMANFPNGLRQNLCDTDASFTSSAATCHLLSFAEYCAMYLMTLSNVLWPKKSDGFPAPTSVNAPAVSSLSVASIAAPFAGEDQAAIDRDDCERRVVYCEELEIIKDFVGGLGGVRRALANIATYMILDDHEVTDDWYLTLGWRKKVLGSPLGPLVLRNALTAYLFFQGWGNDPAAFATGGANAGLLDTAANAITGRHEADLAALDDKLGLKLGTGTVTARWDYKLRNTAWPYGFLVLDERTHRGANLGSDVAPPARIDLQDMPNQIPTAQELGQEAVLFVIAPAPVLGVPVLEELIQGGVSRFLDTKNVLKGKKPAGAAAVDLEPWSQDPIAFEQLLARLAPAGRVVFLSGDVHFAHAAGMTYWSASRAQPSRFVQLTSSALKNGPEGWLLELIRTFGFGQRILRARAPASRLGWTQKEPIPLTFPASSPFGSFSIPVRARFRQEPLLLPGQVWPAGTAFVRQPDWTWSMQIIFDTQPEADRADRPLLTPDLTPPTAPVAFAKLPAVARYHIDALTQRGMDRQTVFAHNIGVVSIANPGGVFSATHTIFAPLARDTDKIDKVTVHTASLDPDPAAVQPGLQA